jgi:hypothetical protein
LYRGKPDWTTDIAKDLIELSGRSETVYNRVKEVTETFSARKKATELLPLVLEAGYDLAAIQSIANSCEANGWSFNEVTEAVSVLAKRDTAMMAIAEQVVELVVLSVQNRDAAIIVEGGVQIGMEAVANVEGLGEFVADIGEGFLGIVTAIFA